MQLEKRKSSSYKRRQELMGELIVPTISETKDHLGGVLAAIVLQESSECQKEDLGLEPPLIGTIGELWTSPSDLLIGKVCLKPPLTQRHIQALTHEGILDIGTKIEKKFWYEMEMTLKRELEEAENRLKKMFAIEKSRAIAETMEEERKKHAEEINELRVTFENRINQLIRECAEQILLLEKEQKIEIDSLNAIWQEKLDDEIMNTVVKLTDEFLEKLGLQEHILVDTFMKQIDYFRMQQRCVLDFERVKNREIIIQMRHQLECQNIANLMYVLCKERKKCKAEKQALEKYYQNIIRKNKKEIKTYLNSIRKQQLIINKKKKQLAIRERIVVEILRQFQKFIYYALRATPTQGEFLLNIDKLIKFELDDYCFAQKKKISMPAAPKQELSVEPQIIDICDYLEDKHFCLADYDEEEFEESDVLPVFYFDEKVYIREDFRDMFSAGIKIDKGHPLWNKDVEELVNMFRASIEEKRSICQNSLDNFKNQYFGVNSASKVTNSKIEQSKGPVSTDMNKKRISNNGASSTSSPPIASLAKNSSFEMEEKEIRKISLVGSRIKDSQNAMKPEIKKTKKSTVPRETLPLVASIPDRISVKSPEDYEGKTKTEVNSKLMKTKDSVILHISTAEKKTLQNISRQTLLEKLSKCHTEENTDGGASEISIDDVELKQISFTSQSGSERDHVDHIDDSEENRSGTSFKNEPTVEDPHTSKLLLAQDSIEMIKSHLSEIDNNNRLSLKGDKTFSDNLDVVPYSSPKSVKSISQGKVRGRHKRMQIRRPTAKVAGSRQAKEHEKTTEEFTEERIKSLVNLMKENPSLIRLFTACSK